MTDTTTPADTAGEIRSRFSAVKATIEADKDLSPEGKATRIAAATETANAAIAKLAATVENAVASEKASLELRLLSIPSAPLGSTPTDRTVHQTSYRDAITRAQQTTTPAQLLELQRTANVIGDTLLARATLVVGLERGDADVVNGWSKANPKLEADVDRLWALTHTRGSSETRRQIAKAFAFSAVQ